MGFSSFRIFRTSSESEAIKDLKASIHRATIDLGQGRDSEIKNDIKNILRARPALLPEAVTLIKERIKNTSVSISYNGMCVIDEMLNEFGFEFQEQVATRVLERVLKLAMPQKGTHPTLQRKAATLIKGWAESFGSDPHLAAFSKAADELSRKELAVVGCDSTAPSRATSLPTSEASTNSETDNAQISVPLSATAAPKVSRSGDLSRLTTLELLELAKVSQVAISKQMQTISDPEKIKQLSVLYQQLSDDIQHYSRRTTSVP